MLLSGEVGGRRKGLGRQGFWAPEYDRLEEFGEGEEWDEEEEEDGAGVTRRRGMGEEESWVPRVLETEGYGLVDPSTDGSGRN